MKGFLFLVFLVLQDASQNGPWSGFWKEFLLGILTAIVISFLGWLFLRIRSGIRNLLRARSRYRITGTWIGSCRLHRHPPKVEAVEIYRLVTKKEYVKFTFFHYLPNMNDVRRYEGAGIYRGMVLSAFYYIPEPQCSESGVFVLRKVGEKFKGVYAQYDLISNENFVLRRVHISTWSQVKMMFGRAPFHCHQQARDLYDAAVKEQPEPNTRLKPSSVHP